MKSKNRYAVGFWIAVAVITILLIGFVAVFASIQARTNGGNFNVSFTAVKVKAEITASYQKPGASTYDFLEVSGTTDTTMQFNTEETITKTFEDAPSLSFTRDNNTLVLRYAIKNTGIQVISVSRNFAETTAEGVTITYAAENDLTSLPTANPTTWENSKDVALPENTEIAAGKMLVFYVQIELNDDVDSAAFAGAYNFSLTLAE